MARHTSKKLVVFALCGNLVITLAKFALALSSGSAALMAEGWHSLADTGNQVLLLIGLKAAKKPADASHPFGYGKEQYFYSFVVANSLFSVGALVALSHGWRQLTRPVPIEHIGLSLAVLALAAVIDAGPLYMALKQFRRLRGQGGWFKSLITCKDSALMVVLLEDTAALLGVLLAAAGLLMAVATGEPRWDGIASLGIGLTLGVVAALLAYRMKELLVGESADPATLAIIRAILADIGEVDRIGEVLTMHTGPDDLILAINIDFKNDVPTGSLEVIIRQIETRIKVAIPAARQIFIEAQNLKPRPGPDGRPTPPVQ